MLSSSLCLSIDVIVAHVLWHPLVPSLVIKLYLWGVLCSSSPSIMNVSNGEAFINIVAFLTRNTFGGRGYRINCKSVFLSAQILKQMLKQIILMI